MNTQRNGESGFTLVEVAIAMATVAVLSFGVLAALTTSTVQDRVAFETTRTQNVAASWMEQVEAIPFDQLLLFIGQPVTFASGKWTFSVNVTEVARDLLAIDCAAQVTGSPDETIRLATLKSRKEEL